MSKRASVQACNRRKSGKIKDAAQSRRACRQSVDIRRDKGYNGVRQSDRLGLSQSQMEVTHDEIQSNQRRRKRP